MNDRGFIKISRNLLNWRWYKNLVTKSVFLHLLLTANYEESELETIKIERGQVVTSYPSLSENLGITIRQARTAVEHLKSTGELTAKTYPKFQVISIVNYDLYQSKPTGKKSGKCQADDSQDDSRMTPSKNIDNKLSIKNKEEEKESAAAQEPFSSSPSAEATLPETPAEHIPYAYEVAGYSSWEEMQKAIDEEWG